MDIWMRLVAACEAFREREGSSAPGVLRNNILMNEKLATRSFERNHWLLSGLCPDHGLTLPYRLGKVSRPSVQNHWLDSRCARMNEEPGVATWKNCLLYSRCDSLARASRVWLSSLIVSLY